MNSAGTTLAYSTYLGGTNNDVIHALAVDMAGAAYVAGETFSPDFPTTSGAAQTGYSDGGQFLWSEAFLTKLRPSGGGLSYSTFLGGSRHDVARSVAIDGSGNAYLAGETSSTDFPVTGRAVQPDNADGGAAFDAFAARVEAAGDRVRWATYLGGSRTDLAAAIAVDDAGVVTIAGETDSGDFPALGAGCEGLLPPGGRDAFVTRLESAGSVIGYSMFLGGTAEDRATGLAIDRSGNAYVGGETYSPNFPTTGAAVRAQGEFLEGFAARIAPTPVTAGPCISPAGVVNAASYASGAVSPGEIVLIYGNGIGPPQLAGGEITADGRFSDTLAGVRVLFDGVAAR